MSEPILIAIIGSIAPTTASIAAVIIGLRNTGKLTQIHTLTNSNLTKVTNSLEQANQKISSLERLINSMNKTKE